MSVPVIGFSGFSGSGKTTLLEGLIPLLTARGFRIGIVKHDSHGFQMDHPGRDTFRHAAAGAASVLITSPVRSAQLEARGLSLEECLGRLSGVDLVLVEGFKYADIPRVGICRRAAGLDYPEPPERYIALVADEKPIASPVPVFSFDETGPLAEFLIHFLNNGLRTDDRPKEPPSVPPSDPSVKEELPGQSGPPGKEEEGTAVSEDFTHFNDQGRARMVDVGEKAPSRRTAVAAGRVLVSRQTFDLIRTGGVKKGDVLTVAQVAGIMAAKHTPDWIPMCHPVPLSGVDLRLWLDEARLSVEIRAEARCDGKTGVEMEALTAVSCAALTVYDMCKAVQRDMIIEEVRLLYKSGGVHGDYAAET